MIIISVVTIIVIIFIVIHHIVLGDQLDETVFADLSFPYENCNASLFTDDFTSNFSRALRQAFDNNGVDSSKITISGYRCGSIVVSIGIIGPDLAALIAAVVARGNLSVYIGSTVFQAANFTLMSSKFSFLRNSGSFDFSFKKILENQKLYCKQIK